MTLIGLITVNLGERTMDTEVGIIATLIGTAIATAADGSQRILQVGDKVYQDEIITTGVTGAVEIEFNDGSIMALGRSSQSILDLEILNSEATIQTQDNVQDDVEALQQALIDGVDPAQVSEVTAASAEDNPDGNQGVDIVRVIHEAAIITPETSTPIGFDTTGPVAGTQNDVALDEAAPDEAAPDEVAPDEVAPDEVAPDEVAPDETAPDETAPDEAAPDEVAPDEAAPDVIVPNETINLTPVVTPEILGTTETLLVEGAPVVNGNIDAFDPEGSSLSYTLLDAAPAGLTFNTDGSYSFDPSHEAYQSLNDGELHDPIVVGVRVTDPQGAFVETTLTINVTGVSDLSTVSDVDASGNNILDRSQAGTYTGITLESVDGNGEAVTYSSDNPLFSINAYGRVVTTAEVDIFEQSSYTFNVTATNESGETNTSSVTVDVRALTTLGPTVSGTAADDTFSYDTYNNNAVKIIGGEGNDTVRVGSGSFYSYKTGDFSSTEMSSIEKIEGSGSSDTIIGNESVHDYAGGSGRDHITGTSGSDTIDGGRHNDTLIGGDGDDIFTYNGTDNGVDVVAGGEGNDILQGGSGDDVIGLDHFTGANSVEKIDGGEGNDTIRV
ncbi:MAG: retention module-containing protein, partial [Methylococcaceae bacterium]|nr:retention module-containing protein [Methylococcaceae bacterium]